MSKLAAGLKNPTTTTAAVFLVLSVLFTTLSAQFDADPETVPDWNYVVLAVISAVGFFMSRDADKSSEQSGVK